VRILFTAHGRQNYTGWTGDRKNLRRINRLIQDAVRDPSVGTGKPEPLSGDRLVYTVRADDFLITLIERVPGSGRAVRHRLTDMGHKLRKLGDQILSGVLTGSCAALIPQ
jgi:toxin YoeB